MKTLTIWSSTILLLGLLGVFAGCSKSGGFITPDAGVVELCPGGCAANETCSPSGVCVACSDSCNERECGDDGCGGSCGSCPTDLFCSASGGICNCADGCTPNCAGKACGPDECGGSCGACGSGQVCMYDRTSSPSWQCGDFAGTSPMMSFFITSRPTTEAGGNLGGLTGADAYCTTLAEAAGVTGKTWRAYLSVQGTDARDRIGTGPWFNAMGVAIASGDCNMPGSQTCVEALFADEIANELMVTEIGTQIGRIQGHDIWTGSNEQGLWEQDSDCQGWTSNSSDDIGFVGHHDGDVESGNWSGAHTTGCHWAGLACTGGRGHLYCFAI